IRYAPLVAERGGRVLLECQPGLCRLLMSVVGIDRVIAHGEVLPAFDAHLPLISLPRLFASTLDTVPFRVPYLTPAPSALTIETTARLTVGMAWTGNPRHGNNHNRSFALTHLMRLSLLLPDVAVFSLQKGSAAEAEL